jgi:uncharacterized protein YndB with AHSA1/START domain
MTTQLNSIQEGVEPFVISRNFDAPRDRMWNAWSRREQLMQWFGPKGFEMPAAKLDFRPGGVFHYCLEAPNGDEMWGKFAYIEIEPGKQIRLVSCFSDEDGNVTRHPLCATWPLEMLSTIIFAEKAGRTTVTIRWAPLNPTEAERETFEASHDGMKQGWSGTFDQLADYLAKAEGEAL